MAAPTKKHEIQTSNAPSDAKLLGKAIIRHQVK